MWSKEQVKNENYSAESIYTKEEITDCLLTTKPKKKKQLNDVNKEYKMR